MKGNIANIMGIPINSGCFGQLLDKIVSATRRREQVCLVFTPNPEFFLKAEKDENFKKILQSADINIPDGFGLVLWSRLLRLGIKERITGADMVKALLVIGDKEKWRVGLIGLRGGDVEQGNKQRQRLKELYPAIEFVDLSSFVTEGNRYQVIFACQGAIAQEKWIWANRGKYKAGVMMGIGGSLDFLTGFTKRAPKIVQNFGLEWLWRIFQKPKHYKRALKSIFAFSWLMINSRR